MDGDPATAAALVHAATSDGIDVRTLYLQVLQPALYEIGRRWEEAEISIAQEHLATATTQSLMARLAERLEHTTPRGRTALVAGAEGELHSIGARMVADFLEADGWDVLFVGALSPVDALAEMAADRGVDVVALSASLSERLPEVIAAVRALGGARATAADRRRRPGLRRRSRPWRWPPGPICSPTTPRRWWARSRGASRWSRRRSTTGCGARTRSSPCRSRPTARSASRTRRSSGSRRVSWRACRWRR